MTRYLIGDQQLRYAIHSAINAMNIDKQDKNHIIDSTVKASDEVLESLASSKTTESFDLIGFVKTYRDMPSKTGDFWTPMKFITANPKPVNGIPPVSYRPRYGALIRPDTTQHCINEQPENNAEYYRRILEIYKNNPDPPFCHNYGQRFKYVGKNQLAYKHQSNRADILHTLKLKAETQPTFDLAELNQ